MVIRYLVISWPTGRKGVQNKLWVWCLKISSIWLLTTAPGWCETPTTTAQDLKINPEMLKNSPVLRRWQRQIPNILEEIRNDPSFRTRLRLGYFPSIGDSPGIFVALEDAFIGRSGFTVSGKYQTAFDGERVTYGADVNYYVRPLGSYINIAPVVGYRNLQVDNYSTDGLNLGVKLLLVLSRGGAADIALTQSWVAIGTGDEAGLTTLSLGYAITKDLRISTELQQQNTRQDKESRAGLVVEWLP